MVWRQLDCRPPKGRRRSRQDAQAAREEQSGASYAQSRRQCGLGRPRPKRRRRGSRSSSRALAFMFAANAREDSIASHTLSKRCFFLALRPRFSSLNLAWASARSRCDRAPRLLGEGVQDIHGLGRSRVVDHAKRAAGIAGEVATPVRVESCFRIFVPVMAGRIGHPRMCGVTLSPGTRCVREGVLVAWVRRGHHRQQLSRQFR